MRIVEERPADRAAVEALVDSAFGPDRLAKTVYRLREGVEPATGLSLVARAAGGLVGTLRFWPVEVAGRTPALLLGPLAVAEAWRGRGVGSALMRRGLNRATAAGHRLVLLVGDEPYYRRFGFTRDLVRAVTLPGPVDLARFLGLELAPGAGRGLAGTVGRIDEAGVGSLLPPAAAGSVLDIRSP